MEVIAESLKEIIKNYLKTLHEHQRVIAETRLECFRLNFKNIGVQTIEALARLSFIRLEDETCKYLLAHSGGMDDRNHLVEEIPLINDFYLFLEDFGLQAVPQFSLSKLMEYLE